VEDATLLAICEFNAWLNHRRQVGDGNPVSVCAIYSVCRCSTFRFSSQLSALLYHACSRSGKSISALCVRAAQWSHICPSGIIT